MTISYVESNLKVCEIGALANLHPITIYKILNERDIPRRKELYNIELAIDMYEQGYYLREIYETTNISQSCLYKELEKRNVPRRRTLRYNYRPSRKSKYTNEILKLYKEGKSKSQMSETVGTVYWLVATAVYLCWSFMTKDWHISWVVWPIAGILFVAAETICDLLIDKYDEK